MMGSYETGEPYLEAQSTQLGQGRKGVGAVLDPRWSSEEVAFELGGVGIYEKDFDCCKKKT
jgi:hypothetical protein